MLGQIRDRETALAADLDRMREVSGSAGCMGLHVRAATPGVLAGAGRRKREAALAADLGRMREVDASCQRLSSLPQLQHLSLQ